MILYLNIKYHFSTILNKFELLYFGEGERWARQFG